jgi:hypothetical protein
MHLFIFNTEIIPKKIWLLILFTSCLFLSCSLVIAQDGTFSDPLNNKAYFHPTHTGILKGFVAGISMQSAYIGVQPSPVTSFAYLNGSYKIGKTAFYCGHGVSFNRDAEGAAPRINTTGIKINAINMKWFYGKNEKIDCDNYYRKPYLSMGFYIGVFNKSIGSGDLIFSKQLVDWSNKPINNSIPNLIPSSTKTDFGGNIELRFPISQLFMLNRDQWTGSISYSVHHLQSAPKSSKATEASFLAGNQNVLLPRYHVYTLSLLHRSRLSKEIFMQWEYQRPVRRIMAGINFFIISRFSMTVAASSHTMLKWSKNINTLIFTANYFTYNQNSVRHQDFFKFFVTYATVVNGLGISPVINRYGLFQIGMKYSRNTRCKFTTNECPDFL